MFTYSWHEYFLVNTDLFSSIFAKYGILNKIWETEHLIFILFTSFISESGVLQKFFKLYQWSILFQ